MTAPYPSAARDIPPPGYWAASTHAAEDLFCHRNTVIYRMKQVEQLTGRSLTSPRDQMLLGLAMMARGA